MRFRRLRRSELPIDTTEMAKFLIGKVLVYDSPEGRMSGRIVETEAYLVGDAAAHSFRGRTERNKSLFLERGHAYVYFIYGTWFSINVSGDVEGAGAGALLRALEPLEGIPLMQRRRPDSTVTSLAKGPGRLATAFGIDRRLDGLDLCGPSPIWLGAMGRPTASIVIGESTRIGLSKEAHRLLRFYERGNPCVSGPKRLNT
jgi:DNA-3-methyladenine glycosylase